MINECTYCGSTRNIQEEHIQAKATLRPSRETIPACADCNQSKGAKPLMVWLRWVKRNRPSKWQEIIDYNYGKRSDIAHKVQRIRDEG